MASNAARVVFRSGWNTHSPHSVSNNHKFRSEFGSWGTDTCMGALSTEAVRELESLMGVSEYEAGEILFMEQEQLAQVFIVLSGEVKLSMQGVGGKRLTIQIAKHGAVLGMDSVLYGSLSEWSADTLHRSRIGAIAREQFYRFAERHLELYRIASRELIGTLQYACSALRIVGLSSCVQERLASQLLAWGEHGIKTGDQTEYRMVLTHAQIAEFIGAARESVTRALIAFKHLGLVEIRGSMLRIPSMTALRKYTERC